MSADRLAPPPSASPGRFPCPHGERECSVCRGSEAARRLAAAEAQVAALRARAEALEELIRDHLSDPAWGEEGRAFNAETMARLRDAARGAKP